MFYINFDYIYVKKNYFFSVFRNSKEIANLKRSVKVMGQKINSLGAIVSQIKKEDNCDTTLLPLKINDCHKRNKINKIVDRLHTYKEEIEDLTSKLSACSDKESKIDWESLESSVSSINNFSSGSSRTNTASSISSTSCILNSKMYPSEATISREFYMFSPSSLFSTLSMRNTFKRKMPSSTITNMLEWSEPKRKRTIGEETDSGNQDE